MIIKKKNLDSQLKFSKLNYSDKNKFFYHKIIAIHGSLAYNSSTCGKKWAWSSKNFPYALRAPSPLLTLLPPQSKNPSYVYAPA